MTACWGSFSWPVFVEVLPIYLGALATGALAMIAFVQLKSQRAEAASRAVIDYLSAENTRGDWMVVRDAFVNLLSSRKYDQFRDPLQAWDKEDLYIVRKILNRYELAAIGIFSGAFDEKTYRWFSRSMMVADYTALLPFIQQVRAVASATAYAELEKLVLQWANSEELSKIKEKQSSFALRV